MIEQDLLEGNKYFNWYWSICNRAKDRVLDSSIYVEKHHIYPKSIYGQNKDLVKLTAKEHYIVHLLLWWGLRTKYGTKDKNTRKMAGAFSSMNMKTKDMYQRYDSREYSFMKISQIERRINTTGIFNHSILSKEKSQKSQPNKKCIYQYDMENGNFIKMYVSLNQVIKYNTNYSRLLISKSCKNENKTTQGYFWSYTKLNDDDIQKRLTKLKKRIYNGYSKKIYQYTLDGNFIASYNSINIASVETCINRIAISNCARGVTKTSGGFIWSLHKINKKLKKYV